MAMTLRNGPTLDEKKDIGGKLTDVKTRPNTVTMDKFPIPVWEWSRQMLDISYNYPHRVEDFAKSFSRNQFYAKCWMMEVLRAEVDFTIDRQTRWWILGSWYGTLIIPLIWQYFGTLKKIHMCDFDGEALEIAERLHGKRRLMTHAIDVNWEFERLAKVKTDIMVNTSCEHMYPMTDFKTDALCVFQSTNFKEDYAHINAVDSLEEFEEQCNMTQVLWKGEIPFHDYDDHHKRFMIIGYKS